MRDGVPYGVQGDRAERWGLVGGGILEGEILNSALFGDIIKIYLPKGVFL